MLTRLVTPARRLLDWQAELRDMERPYRFTVEVESRCNTLGLATIAMSDGTHWTDALYPVITFIGLRNPVRLKYRSWTKTVLFTWLEGSVDPGVYMVEMTWDSKIALNVRLMDYTPRLDSFGSQNVCRFQQHSGYVPYVLSPHIRDLDYACIGYDFKCTAVQYWDLTHVRTLRGFLSHACNFRGDLSRMVILPHHQWQDAFEGCGAVKFPRACVDCTVGYWRGDGYWAARPRRDRILRTATTVLLIGVLLNITVGTSVLYFAYTPFMCFVWSMLLLSQLCGLGMTPYIIPKCCTIPEE